MPDNVGRPPIYETKEELQERIDEYFREFPFLMGTESRCRRAKGTSYMKSSRNRLP